MIVYQDVTGREIKEGDRVAFIKCPCCNSNLEGDDWKGHIVKEPSDEKSFLERENMYKSWSTRSRDNLHLRFAKACPNNSTISIALWGSWGGFPVRQDCFLILATKEAT